MVVKRGLPEELATTLRQLVMNGSIRIAGTLLYSYCRRVYQVDDATAARWMQVYFYREFPQQLQRYLKRTAKNA
ncbi:hypothetical protein [Paenibacillus ehimensis]|uniref:hypothetical protein n=1 Tax=Paenibacillus ehimensis TaxID=79264 RepID=UPI000FDA33AA|nr:hypothetical protein [Paenibacillus ehimensis]